MVSKIAATLPLSARPPAPRRAIGLWIGAALLFVSCVVLLGVDRELDGQMSVALTNQRVHIQKVTAIRRSARSAYVLLLERWLRPLPERGAQERAVEQAVNAIRQQTDDFASGAALSAAEGEARNLLVRAVAMWSNRVHQAVVAADGPPAMADLRELLDEIDLQTDRVEAIDSSEGKSTDARVAVLHARQASIQAGFVVVAAAILVLALVWWRGKLTAERRFQVSERARAAQEHAEQLRTQFFANTSHELRTPLVAIRGFAAVIADTPDIAPPVRDATLRIDREAADLLGQIDNILDAAKLARGAIDVLIGDVDVEKVVRRCVQRCTPLVAAKVIALEVDVPPELPRLQSDAVKLQHVLTNLVANAIKFTESGRVSIRARSLEGSRIALEVEDTGIGIPAEAIERIWNPFEQADPGVARRFGGTGLGLSIVRGLVDRLGGKVSVESAVGRGTTFSVVFPTTFSGAQNA
jgi:signal transduction histidine kinase